MLPTTLPIETDRLTLRAFTDADAARYFSYRRLPATVRYLYRDPLTLEESIERMPQYARLEFEKDADIFNLAIHPRGADELAGEVLLKLASLRAMQAELGYSLHPDSVGRGYATEAARAMLGLAFEHFGFHRVFARIDSENSASIAVAERLGMRREAHLVENDRFNGRWGSEFVYATLAAEWPAGTSGLPA